MIHRFNQMGLASLDPQWAGGRPRLISPEDEAFIVATATMRPETLDQPFTRWSLRKLAAYLAKNPQRVVRVGREWLRQFLRKHEITFQRTKTWKDVPRQVVGRFSGSGKLGISGSAMPRWTSWGRFQARASWGRTVL